ncbi:MAG: hypothetical protein HFH35_13995 [Eubacterium sp.]|nr:hypothetical protein [Eubacterium sp.]
MQKGKKGYKNPAKVEVIVCIVCFSGIFLRYLAMSLGHNFDFESYCIVGEIASRLGNVYAQTSRYNYSPAFLCIQGICYGISQWLSLDPLPVYRVCIVGILTIADLGIACWIRYRYSLWLGIVFFLNPVSIIITGYHNQFDNIAVLFALLSCNFYNEAEDFHKKDALFVALLTASLLIKHIFWVFPFWILVNRNLPFRKKIVYTFVPPIVFLMSFVPFAAGNEEAFDGIVHNVFLYRSFNNSPLLASFFHMVKLPNQYWFVVFMAAMLLFAFAVRGQSFEYQVCLYLLSVVSFSSSIANQYLAICVAALCIVSRGICRYCYFAVAGLYLVLHTDGLGFLTKLEQTAVPDIFFRAVSVLNREAYFISAFILAILLAREILDMHKLNYKSRILRYL